MGKGGRGVVLGLVSPLPATTDCQVSGKDRGPTTVSFLPLGKSGDLSACLLLRYIGTMPPTFQRSVSVLALPNKYHSLGSCKHCLTFWRPEAQNQGVGGATLPLQAKRDGPSAPPSTWWPQVVPGLWQHHSNLHLSFPWLPVCLCVFTWHCFLCVPPLFVGATSS